MAHFIVTAAARPNTFNLFVGPTVMPAHQVTLDERRNMFRLLSATAPEVTAEMKDACRTFRAA